MIKQQILKITASGRSVISPFFAVDVYKRGFKISKICHFDVETREWVLIRAWAGFRANKSKYDNLSKLCRGLLG